MVEYKRYFVCKYWKTYTKNWHVLSERVLARPECSEFIDDFAASYLGVLTL